MKTSKNFVKYALVCGLVFGGLASAQETKLGRWIVPKIQKTIDNIRRRLYGQFQYKKIEDPSKHYPFYVVQDFSETFDPKTGDLKEGKKVSNPNRLTILDDGLAALRARLELIEEAKRSIELDYFMITFTNKFTNEDAAGVLHKALGDYNSSKIDMTGTGESSKTKKSEQIIAADNGELDKVLECLQEHSSPVDGLDCSQVKRDLKENEEVTKKLIEKMNEMDPELNQKMKGHKTHKVRSKGNGMDLLLSKYENRELKDGDNNLLDNHFHTDHEGNKHYINSSTKLIFQKLIEKAFDGVKVRIIADTSIAIFNFTPKILKMIHNRIDQLVDAEAEKMDWAAGEDSEKKKGTFIANRRKEVKENFQVGYYNKTAALPSHWLIGIQYRTHRKLLSIDRKKAITGGRNIEDEYYDLAPDFNYDDRDVLVEGPIVAAMVDSFNEYWPTKVNDRGHTVKNKTLTKFLEFDDYAMDVQYNVRSAEGKADKLLQTKLFPRKEDEPGVTPQEIRWSKRDEQIYDRITHFGDIALQKSRKELSGICPITTYVSDKPLPHRFARFIGALNFLRSEKNKKSYKNDFRYTERAIFDHIAKALAEEAVEDREACLEEGREDCGAEILVSSPYMIPNNRITDVAREILKKGSLKLLSNTLQATDAVYVSAPFYHNMPMYLAAGVDVRMHVGSRDNAFVIDDDPIHGQASSARFGIHSKTFVFGKNRFYIGTYNVDNRSSFYNSEMGILCEGNPELTAKLRGAIEKRINDSNMKMVLNPGRELKEVAFGVEEERSFLNPDTGEQEKVMVTRLEPNDYGTDIEDLMRWVSVDSKTDVPNSKLNENIYINNDQAKISSMKKFMIFNMEILF